MKPAAALPAVIAENAIIVRDELHLRFPCPPCGWAERRAERTRLVTAGSGGADFAAVCTDHDDYKVTITPDSHAYLDLATLYRNLVKEPWPPATA